MLELKRFMLCLDMGSGKTILALMLLRYRKQRGEKPKAVVFVPYLTSVETWVEETAKHTPDLKCVPLLGTTKDNLAALSQDADLFVICYQSAVAMLAEKGPKGWVLSAERTRKCFHGFDTLIADEVHKCFPCGTKIITPMGSRNIEDLRIGDEVETGFGPQKITNVFASKTRQLLNLILEDGTSVRCTPNHPFLTDGGWVESRGLFNQFVFKNETVPNLWKSFCWSKADLKILFTRLCLRLLAWQGTLVAKKKPRHTSVCGMWDYILSSTSFCKEVLWKALFGNLENATTRNKDCGFHRREGQKDKRRFASFSSNPRWVQTGASAQSTNADKEPNCQPGNTIKNFGFSEENWARSKKASPWKWVVNTFSSLTEIKAGTGMAGRVPSPFRRKMGERLPLCLQSRFGQPSIEDSSRVRREIAQRPQKQEARLKARYKTGRSRVVNISIEECSDPETVFNIEVDRHPYYFANGILVHNCKSPSSLTYRMCRAIAAEAEYVFGLTGTPFGRDLGDLWPQFFLVDFGETLGPTFGFYRSMFFSTKINYWGGYEYTFKKKLLGTLHRVLKNASISYSVEELRGMPPKEYVERRLGIPSDAKGYIAKAIEALQDAIRGKEFRQVESSYLQLRQLASGFMTLRGEDSEKLHVKFGTNPKLELLEELIESMPAASKAVVFNHFVFTGQLISDRLKELKIKHARIWGGQKDPIGELRRFKQDPDCRILVCNIKSGSSSLNLQNAQYLVFFEQPDSPIDRKQAEARVWRSGQTERVLIYDFLMNGTADVRLHKANQDDRSLMEELLSGEQL